ncbi:hypothetical protein KSP40_PGU007149 [Platanthera guangdongensis]|uniref:Uncharacterized protein n=1 Tax=Platanthera guangdongensis TaxID=2320717 RepID=A0ABR2LXD3_9ASPA
MVTYSRKKPPDHHVSPLGPSTILFSSTSIFDVTHSGTLLLLYHRVQNGRTETRLFGLIFGEVSISYNRSNHTSYMFNPSWRSIYASPKIDRSIFASPQDNRIAYESSILPKIRCLTYGSVTSSSPILLHFPIYRERSPEAEKQQRGRISREAATTNLSSRAALELHRKMRAAV